MLMDNFISLRRLRKWIVTASIVTLLSALVVVPTAMGQYFDDVPEGIWYESYVNDLAEQGIVDRDGEYNPGENMNRAEIAKVAVLAAPGLEIEECTEKPFDDVEVDDWFCRYVNTAKSYNIVGGYTDAATEEPTGMYGPGDYVQRDAMAKIIKNAFGIDTMTCEGNDVFTDVESGTWYHEYVESLYLNCIVDGVNNGNTYEPGSLVLRSEAAKFISLGMNPPETCDNMCPTEEFTIVDVVATSATTVEVEFSLDVDETLAADEANYTVTYEGEEEEVVEEEEEEEVVTCTEVSDCEEGETCNSADECEALEEGEEACDADEDCTVEGEVCGDEGVCEAASVEGETMVELGVSGAAVAGNTVTLTTDSQEPGMEYTLMVENVTSVDGTPLSQGEETFLGFDDSLGGALVVTINADTPDGGTVPLGASGIHYLYVDFTVPASEEDPVNLSGVDVKRTGIGATTNFDNVYAYEGDDRLTNGRSFASDDNIAEFNNLGVSITPGETVTLGWIADMANAEVNAGAQNAFRLEGPDSIRSNATEVTFDPEGESITGNTIEIGSQAVGQLTVEVTGSLDDPTVGSCAPIAKARVTADGESASIEKMAFTIKGSISEDTEVEDLSLKIQGTEDVLGTADSVIGSLATVVLDTPFDLDEGQDRVFQLDACAGGEEGNTVRTYVDESTDITAIGGDFGYGMRVDNNDYDGDDTADNDGDGAVPDYSEVTMQGGTFTVGEKGSPVTGTVTINSNDTSFLDLTFTSERNVDVEQLQVTVEADDNDDGLFADDGDDTDEDGLYNNVNGTWNVSNVRIWDVEGSDTLMGPGEPTAFVAGGTMDGTYTYTFNEAFPMDASQTIDTQVTLDVDNDCPANESFRVTLETISQTEGIRDLDNNEYITDIVPGADIVGNPLTTTTASASISQGTIVDHNVTKGSETEALDVIFQAGSSEDIKVTEIQARIYTDTSEADAGADNAANWNDATDSAVVDRVPTVSLYEGTWDAENAIGSPDSPGDVPAAGQPAPLVFSGLNWVIPADGNTTLLFVLDTSNNGVDADNENIAIEVRAQDITAEVATGSNAGNAVVFTGGTINTVTSDATDNEVEVNVITGGALTASQQTSDPLDEINVVVDNTADTLFSRTKYTATEENIKVEALQVLLGYDFGTAVVAGNLDVGNPIAACPDAGAANNAVYVGDPGDLDDNTFVRGEMAYVNVDSAADAVDDATVEAGDIRLTPYWNGTIYYAPYSTVTATDNDFGDDIDGLATANCGVNDLGAAGVSSGDRYYYAVGIGTEVAVGDVRMYGLFPEYGKNFSSVSVTDGTLTHDSTLSSGIALFTMSGDDRFEVPQDGNLTLDVEGALRTIKSDDSAAISGDYPILTIGAGPVDIANGDLGGTRFKAIGEDSNNLSYTPGAHTGTMPYPQLVRMSNLKIEKGSVSTTTLGAGEFTLFNATLTPEGGDAYVKRMAFDITTSGLNGDTLNNFRVKDQPNVTITDLAGNDLTSVGGTNLVAAAEATNAKVYVTWNDELEVDAETDIELIANVAGAASGDSIQTKVVEDTNEVQAIVDGVNGTWLDIDNDGVYTAATDAILGAVDADNVLGTYGMLPILNAGGIQCFDLDGSGACDNDGGAPFTDVILGTTAGDPADLYEGYVFSYAAPNLFIDLNGNGAYNATVDVLIAGAATSAPAAGLTAYNLWSDGSAFGAHDDFNSDDWFTSKYNYDLDTENTTLVKP